MKSLTLLTLAFLTLGHLSVAPAAIKSTDIPEEDRRAPNPKVLETYRQVLAQVPADLRPTNPREWTNIQRDKANAAIEQAFLQLKTTGKFSLQVKNIADWNAGPSTPKSPNEEGYMIRVILQVPGRLEDKLAAVTAAIPSPSRAPSVHLLPRRLATIHPLHQFERLHLHQIIDGRTSIAYIFRDARTMGARPSRPSFLASSPKTLAERAESWLVRGMSGVARGSAALVAAFCGDELFVFSRSQS